jgi:hypothetical protein
MTCFPFPQNNPVILTPFDTRSNMENNNRRVPKFEAEMG